MEENTHSYDPDSLPDLLPIYYKRLFPHGPYYRWLNYGGVPKTHFLNREFSFTLKDDVYIRYQSFSDQSEMEKEIQKRCPYKIDIGAIFSHKPKEHKTVKQAAFQALEKELVFDIDITDYDDVRFCCSGADICPKCWPLMTIAIKIIDRALREDFGFQHLLWVYSGRRGVHCWVADEIARKMTQTGRSAVSEYLNVVKGGENQTKKITLSDNIHPSIQRAINIIEEDFKSYAVKKQDFLGSEEKREKVKALINHEDFKNKLEEGLAKGNNGAEYWAIFEDRVQKYVKAKNDTRPAQILKEIMLQYCYPRLDINVSKGVNHLLKSPFCVHPKTGRVCVPIDHTQPHLFDPFSVPTISQICEELNTKEKNGDENSEPSAKRTLRDYKQTSMKKSVDIFTDFVKKLESTWKGKLQEVSDQKMDF